MQNGKRIVCVLPAYNAARTLERTLRELSSGIVDLFILVDDCSQDDTAAIARTLAREFPMHIIPHEHNRGYGGNQKTCYRAAIAAGADVIVMLHPDYQYDPRLLGALAHLVSCGTYDVALGSRILGKGAISGGMPSYKYYSNRALTLIQNLLIGQKLSEYHTGYRAYARHCLEAIPFKSDSDDFMFDNQMVVQLHLAGFSIGQSSVPKRYSADASSISFWRSVTYGYRGLSFSIRRFAIPTQRRWSSIRARPRKPELR